MGIFKHKGYTLIELALVVIILGILAVITFNHLGNNQASVECAMIKEMATRLTGGIKTYSSEEGHVPSGINLYVTTKKPPFDAPSGTTPNRIHYNLSTYSFGGNARQSSPCGIPTADTMTCTNTFSNYTHVVYTYDDGKITFTAPSMGEAAACQE